MSTKKMSLAASYARTNTPDGMRLQQQHTTNTERAAADGFEIPADARYRFSDDDSSGTRTSRRGFDALRDLVVSGEADFSRVYMTDVSREGRFDDPRYHLFLHALFQSHGVRLCHGDQDEQIDLSEGLDVSEMGSLLADFLKSVNAYAERHLIRDRTTGGARAWASQGFYPNKNTPYATQRSYADERTGDILGPVDENQRRLARGQRFKLRFVDDERRLAVVEIFHRILDGESSAAVARDLTARAIPSPGGAREWRPEAVRRIATNPIYTGRLEWGRTTRDEPALPPGETPINGGTAPLLIRHFVPDAPIAEELFDAVQVALQGRRDEYHRRRRLRPGAGTV